MGNRLLAVLAAGLLLGCQTVTTYEDGSTKVRSFGAGTVTVLDDGTVETTSPGLSEGFSGVVTYAVQAVANLVAVVLPFPAPAAPAPPVSSGEVAPHTHTVQ